MPTPTFSSNANRADLKPSSKSCPCPVCDRTKDGDCRIHSDGMILCRTYTGKGLNPGDPAPSGAPYRFIGTSTKAYDLGMWKPAAEWMDRGRLQASTYRRKTAPLSPQLRASAIPAGITLPTKLIRPQGQESFHFTQWNGTPVKATKVRIDHGNGQPKEVSWRPALSNEGLSQADLAPWNWHRAVAAHEQNGGPVVVLKGELKAQWLNDCGVSAISINGWDPTLEQQLKPLGNAVVLAPDCDLSDLRGWYAKAAAALPQARHLLVPGANWAQPPEKDGVGIDDWLQRQPAITAQEIIQAITNEGWGGDEEEKEKEQRTYTELLDVVLEATRNDADNDEMHARAELKIRFRLSDEQISTGLWKRYGQQKTSTTHKSTDSVDLARVVPLGYRMDGWIPFGDLSMLYGPYGTGKTTLAIWKAYSLAKGINILDRSEPCKPGRTLFIATDSGAASLKKSLHDLGIDTDTDPLFQLGHPEQAIWVWAHEPDQGHEAWVCDIRGIIKLEAFIKKNQITYCAIDSAKSVSASAGWSYTSNEAVKAVLKVIRECICQPLGCCVEFISHDGSEKGAHSGARAWAEDPSMVCSLTLNKGEDGRPDSVAVEFRKDRAAATDPRRKLAYTLAEETLTVTAGETVGNCRDAILQVFWAAHRNGKDVLTVKGLQDEVFAKYGKSRKTVENTLRDLVGSATGPKPKPLIRVERGRLKLSPLEIQAREAQLLAQGQAGPCRFAQPDDELLPSAPNRGVGGMGGETSKSIAAQGTWSSPIETPEREAGGNAFPREPPAGGLMGEGHSPSVPMDLVSSPPLERGLQGGLADSIDPPHPWGEARPRPHPERLGTAAPADQGQKPEREPVQTDKVAAQPGARRPGAAITANGPTAEQAAALGRLQQEDPDSHPATLVLLLDPDGSAGLTGKNVKLWMDSDLAGAVA